MPFLVSFVDWFGCEKPAAVCNHDDGRYLQSGFVVLVEQVTDLLVVDLHVRSPNKKPVRTENNTDRERERERERGGGGGGGPIQTKSAETHQFRYFYAWTTKFLFNYPGQYVAAYRPSRLVT